MKNNFLHTCVVIGYEDLLSMVIDQPQHCMAVKGTALHQYLMHAWPRQNSLVLEELNTTAQKAIKMSFYL